MRFPISRQSRSAFTGALASIVGAGLIVGCATYNPTIESDFEPAPFSVTPQGLTDTLGSPTKTTRLPGVEAIERHCFNAPDGTDHGERCFEFVDGKLYTRVTVHLRFAKEARSTYRSFVTDAEARFGAPALSAQFVSKAKNCTYVTDGGAEGKPDDEAASALASLESPEATTALNSEALCARTQFGSPGMKVGAVQMTPSRLHPGMYLLRYLQFTPDQAVQKRHAEARMEGLNKLKNKVDALMKKVDDL